MAKRTLKLLHKQRTTQKKSVYTKKHYESRDGILTYVWGPPLWHFLHTMSFNYPVEPSPKQKKQYANFVLSLQYILPCGKCRENLQNTFKKLPLEKKDLKGREAFSRYMYHLHEAVNVMLNKHSGLTYEDVRERYEHFRARCRNEGEKVVTEKGCVEPMNGVKSKCVLNIVPLDTKCKTMSIDERCKCKDGSSLSS
jgi:hypothetical protein